MGPPHAPGSVFFGTLIPQLRWEIPVIGDAEASDWAGMCQTERSCPAVFDLPLSASKQKQTGETGARPVWPGASCN